MKEVEKADKRIQFLKYYTQPDSETQGNMRRSALKAGYAESTADGKGKRILENAIKKYKNDVVESRDVNEVLGISENALKSRLRALVEQDENKRVASDLVVKLLDKMGHNLEGDQESKSAPTINIGVNISDTSKEVDYEIEAE